MFVIFKIKYLSGAKNENLRRNKINLPQNYRKLLDFLQIQTPVIIKLYAFSDIKSIRLGSLKFILENLQLYIFLKLFKCLNYRLIICIFFFMLVLPVEIEQPSKI